MRAAIRGVIAFCLVWAMLSVASWLILPRLTGSDAEWVVLATAALMFLISAGAGWVEYHRALRRLREDHTE